MSLLSDIQKVKRKMAELSLILLPELSWRAQCLVLVAHSVIELLNIPVITLAVELAALAGSVERTVITV